MKRLGLHVTNWVSYLVANSLLGKLWGTLFGFLFKGFLTDEAYAEQHPKKYLLGAIGIVILCLLSGCLIIWWPLTKLMEFFDLKIENLADGKDWD